MSRTGVVQHPVEMIAFADWNLADKVLPVIPFFSAIGFPIELSEDGRYRQIELCGQLGELDPLVITDKFSAVKC